MLLDFLLNFRVVCQMWVPRPKPQIKQSLTERTLRPSRTKTVGGRVLVDYSWLHNTLRRS